MYRSVSSIHLQSGVFGTVGLTATSISLKNPFTTTDYRKYVGRGRGPPVSQGQGLHCLALGNAVMDSPDLPKTTSISTNGFSGFKGILVDDMGQICPVNILKSHDNLTYLDFPKLIE